MSTGDSLLPVPDITLLLDSVARGDARAAEDLLPIVYGELRRLAAHKMAGESSGHTLQATALVHEAWLRMVGSEQQQWQNRGHFFAAAAEAMRRILVDHARARKAAKRGGSDAVRVPLDEVPDAALIADGPVDFERLDDALRALRHVSPDRARVVDLRYFAGLSIADAAEVLEVSPATVVRHWTFARAWLYRHMSDPPA